jgi:predicted alpha-1,2-mannosidase
MKSETLSLRRMVILISLSCQIALFMPVSAAEPPGNAAPKHRAETPYDYVNPFIGTREMGHTFPGAAVPFGLVQLGPDTDTLLYTYGDGYNPAIYRYCAGYQYDDTTIVGFSHTHFSGTGHSDLGDFLLMPTVGRLRMNPGTADNPGSGYRSRFSHDTEEAHPGYYTVTLSDYGIGVELTATERTGFHRYRFPETDEAHVILDLTSGIYNYDGKVVWAFVRVENDTLVTGFRQTCGWARTRYLYFAMAFSRPFGSYGLSNDERPLYKGFWRKWDEDHGFPERAGRAVKGHFDFETAAGEEILVKLALSSVSTEGALANLRAEIPHWDFDRVRADAKRRWNAELSRIRIEADEDRLVNFYTALYHCCLSPVVYSDVSGEYRGLDQNIHAADGFTDYTIFSLWDTYRALHPLLAILEPKRTNDMVRSMLAHYEQSVHGMLPIWSHYSNDNWCMIGYHAVPVIVDAYMKGIRDYDVELALAAAVSSATYGKYDGIGYYEQYGYVPEDLNTNSASMTLEYAYDDWTIYRLAETLGKLDAADIFEKRAASYGNIFDAGTGFMRARNSDGSWKTPFDPLSTSGQGFIEGNAWNYSLYVPHDVNGLMDLIGGSDRLVSWIDSLFTMTISEESYAHSEDIEKSGIIGNYVHGNEPSHHIPYLYCYAGAPWKTQERVHQIVDSMYRNAPDGLCGNDDCGQMSAWYIFSALGFYPVCPGSNEYVFGSPCVREAVVTLGSGREFRIRAENLSSANIYIQSITLNGGKHERSYLTHGELAAGGELIYRMGPRQADAWPLTERALPYSMSSRNREPNPRN